jgi:hypothetical protein
LHWIIQSAIRRFELFQDDDLAQTGRGYKARQLSLTWVVCTGVIAIMANAVPALTPSHKAGCDLCVAACGHGWQIHGYSASGIGTYATGSIRHTAFFGPVRQNNAAQKSLA